MSINDPSFLELKSSFHQGRLIPFVGAGFSMVDPDAPSWKGLLEVVANDYGLSTDLVLNELTDNLEQAEWLQRKWEEKKKNGYFTAPGMTTDQADQAAEAQKVENKVATFLKPFPEIVKVPSLSAHRMMLEQFDRIYTTNYDKYFEDVAASLNIKVQKVPQNGAIGTASIHPYLQRNKSCNRITCMKGPKIGSPPDKACRLVKYHGDFELPGTLVLTETSYFKRLLDADAKDVLFAGDALFYDFVFLGYGFSDMSLKYTLQQLDRTFETLGNVSTGVLGKRTTSFYILRTDDRPRSKFQDQAYGLKSLSMSLFVDDGFEGPGSHSILKTFPNSPPLTITEHVAAFAFPSFFALYEAAENRYCFDAACGAAASCLKPHLAPSLVGRQADVTAAARIFRAEVLMEGFSKFLHALFN
jgi:hypothetical protein